MFCMDVKLTGHGEQESQAKSRSINILGDELEVTLIVPFIPVQLGSTPGNYITRGEKKLRDLDPG